MCGEYGEKEYFLGGYGRPHYHAIIFGHNFNDWTYLFDSPGGEPIYTSPTLEKIWGLGFVTVGTVSFESAGYVARYCMKKLNGKAAEKRNEETGLKPYERYDLYTGERVSVWPEYSTMSLGGRRGRGIAYNWFNKYTSDCYPKDFTTINGIKLRPPKAYDRYLREIDVDMYDDIKAQRSLSMDLSPDVTESRQRQIKICKETQINRLVRSL